jgi:hypothetical protein
MAFTLIGQGQVHDGSSMRRRDGLLLFDDIELAINQPRIPLRLDHCDCGRCDIGEVVYLERAANNGVHVVAVADRRLDDDDDRTRLSIGGNPNPISVSVFGTPNVTSGGHIRHRDVTLTEVSLVSNPGASVGPVSWSTTDVRHTKGGHPNSMSSYHRSLADRAHDYIRSNRHSRSLTVVDIDNDNELERLADQHLGDLRRRRDNKVIDAHEQERTANHLAGKFERQGFEVPPELLTSAQVHKRRNLGHIISVR